jgi:chromatin remodeling complex protein RSC6
MSQPFTVKGEEAHNIEGLTNHYKKIRELLQRDWKHKVTTNRLETVTT